jgi:hypothetical protein
MKPVQRVKSLASMSFYSRYVRRYLPDYQKCDWNTWERHDNLNLYGNIEWLGPLPNERHFAVRARMWFWSGKWKSKGTRHALLATFSFAHSSSYFHVPPLRRYCDLCQPCYSTHKRRPGCSVGLHRYVSVDYSIINWGREGRFSKGPGAVSFKFKMLITHNIC